MFWLIWSYNCMLKEKNSTNHYRDIMVENTDFCSTSMTRETQFQRNSKLFFLNGFLQTSAIWSCAFCQVRLLSNLGYWDFFEFFLIWLGGGGLFTKYPNMAEYMYGEITKRVLVTFSGVKSSVQL